jgi:glycosyltransferase involved in cell wall biosynthesis
VTGEGSPCGSVVYLLRSYPRLSQTFILDEMRALERLGIPLMIVAMTDPQERLRQPEVADMAAPVSYLDCFSPLRSIASHVRLGLRSSPRYVQAFLLAARSRESDRGYHVASRFRCFARAVELADLLRREARRTNASVRHLHAHFAHDPAFVALLTNLLTGVPYSFTAHARDLYQIPSPSLVARVERATAVVTICRANRDYLAGLAPEFAGKIRVVHNGLDLRLFPRPSQTQRPDQPVLAAVGRLVEKKGFADLLAACRALVQSGRAFRCRIFGSGPQRSELEEMVRRFGLEDHVSLEGARPRNEIAAALRQADLFVLTPFVTADGDRDGIPNVLVEAMASGLPVVTTSVAGIPELVTDGIHGFVCAPGDVKGIAARISELLDDPARRRRYGDAARATVEERFDVNRAAEQLARVFGVATGVGWCVPTT